MESPFTLELEGTEAELTVVGLRGREALNALYHFEVELTSTASLDPDDTIGRAARLQIATSRTPREVSGLVTAFELRGRLADGRSAARLRIEPRLARLKHASSWRIFHDANVRTIVETLLREHGVPAAWRTADLAAPRPHRVQRGERDLAFLQRILAEEGLMYWFETGADGEELVIADRAEAYAPLHGAATLSHKGKSELASFDDTTLFELVHNRRLRPQRLRARLFDWTLPRRDAKDETPPARSGLAQLLLDEHDHAREGLEQDPFSATRRLEQARNDEDEARATTRFPHVAPGAWFQAEDASEVGLSRAYVVRAVQHVGHAPREGSNERVYEAALTLAPRERAVRPRRPRDLLARGLESATVMGPDREEIHTDDQGRIQVRFHWDTRTPGHPPITAWVRVAQAWGGASYGASFTPRVGDEVLVGYMDGDPDRPVVVGCLHNGTNMSPMRFPFDKTKSGIATRSTPESGGGHLLMFEDRRGEELLQLRSARTLSVEAVGEGSVSTGGPLAVRTGADRSDRTEGNLQEDIGGSASASIGGDRRSQVAGDDVRVVGGDAKDEVAGNAVVKVDGSRIEIVRGGQHTVIGDAGKPVMASVAVAGTYAIGASRGLRLTSEKSVELVCGASRLVLLPDRILLESKTIQLQAEKEINLVQGKDTPSSTLVLDGAASLSGGTVAASSGQGGKLILDADAKLIGALVKLNCDDGDAASRQRIVDENATGDATFRVLPENLPKGTQSVTLVISTPGGEVVEKECPVGGEITLQGRPGDRFTLLDVKVGDRSVAVNDRTPKEEGNG